MPRLLAALTVLLLTPLAGGASAVPPAAATTAVTAAASTATTTHPLAADKTLRTWRENADGEVTSPKNGPVVTLASATRTLAAGEGFHLYGRSASTSNTRDSVEQRLTITCRQRGDSTVVGRVGYATVNHSGTDGTALQAVTLHWGFVAALAGTYTCTMAGQAAQSRGAETRAALTAIAGETYLEAGPVRPAVKVWDTEACVSTGEDCTYLNPGDTHFAFYTGVTPRQRFVAPDTATVLEAWSNLEVTTCYTGTASCKNVVGRPRGADAVLDVRFDVIQLDPAGAKACRITHDPAPGAGNSPDRNFRRETVTDDMHHGALSLAITPTRIAATCGRDFLLRVYVKNVAGQPVKIDGRQNNSVLTTAVAAAR